VVKKLNQFFFKVMWFMQTHLLLCERSTKNSYTLKNSIAIAYVFIVFVLVHGSFPRTQEQVKGSLGIFLK